MIRTRTSGGAGGHATGWLPLAALVVATIAIPCVALTVNRDFWLDEAMLLLAVQEDWVGPGQPLARYGQNLPWGTYVVFKTVTTLAGTTEWLLRLPATLAYLATVVLTYGFVQRTHANRRLSSVTAALVAFTSVAIVQSSEYKQYTIEMLVTVVILTFAQRVRRDGTTTSVVQFLAVSVLCLPFSHLAFFVTGAAGLAIVLALPSEASGQRRWGLGFATGGAAVYGACFLAWYVLAMRPSLVLQLDAPAYEHAGWPSFMRNLVDATALGGLADVSHVQFVLLWGLLVVGVVVAARRRRRLATIAPVTAIVLTVGCAVAAAIGLVPFIAERHVTFMVPVLPLALADIGADIDHHLASMLEQRTSRARTVLSLATVVAIVVAGTFGAGVAAREYQEITEVFPAANESCDMLWYYRAAEPAMTVYADRLDDHVVLLPDGGRLPDGPPRTSGQAPAEVPAFVDVAHRQLRQTARPCLLFSHYDFHPRIRDHDAMVDGAAAYGGDCHLVAEATGVRLYACNYAPSVPG